jgi:regulatory protein YycH of two-component signal transduction system YycFG
VNENKKEYKKDILTLPIYSPYFFPYLIMFLHSLAHARHASAHILHSSIFDACFSHSIAHASHTSAHISHICFAYSLPLDIMQDAITHISAQSRHIIIHRVIIPAICASDIQAVQQASQHSQQVLHASMHV